MNLAQKQFENKWLHKIIRPTNSNTIPKQNYVVVAALLNWDDFETITIFKIRAVENSFDKDGCFSYHLTRDEVVNLENRFQIIK